MALSGFELCGSLISELLAFEELSYAALSDSKLSDFLISDLLALDELSYVALSYWALIELSYMALSSSFPWESVCSFNVGLWRIGTDCVTSLGV